MVLSYDISKITDTFKNFCEKEMNTKKENTTATKMLDFTNYNSISFINRNRNFEGNKIQIPLLYIQELMSNQKIRKTKKNIEVCTNEFLNFLEIELKEKVKSSKFELKQEINRGYYFKEIEYKETELKTIKSEKDVLKMSKQILIKFKCKNNKDIVRGIFNGKNSDFVKISNFTNEDLEILTDECLKVFKARKYKSISYYYNVTDSWGSVDERSCTLANCEIEESNIRILCKNLVNRVNDITSWRGKNGKKFD